MESMSMKMADAKQQIQKIILDFILFLEFHY